MEAPFVSVICLCFNQAAYVQKAIESVWAQTYKEVELVVVDDGSTDGSVEEIKELLKKRPETQFLSLMKNQGNCRAFNHGLRVCKGKYVIDLAADDVLLPERCAVGVKALESAGNEYGVNFTDATYIDEKGYDLKLHYKRNSEGHLNEPVPQGWVYVELLQRYFICTPTMMMRRSVLDALGGYDESLTYEDFDFWIRSSRRWKYHFTDQVLVKKRVVPQSWSAQQYRKNSRQLETTFAVCKKARDLNKTKEEELALLRRVRYELRQALRYGDFEMAGKMLSLKKEILPHFLEDHFYNFFIRACIQLPNRRKEKSDIPLKL